MNPTEPNQFLFLSLHSLMRNNEKDPFRFVSATDILAFETITTKSHLLYSTRTNEVETTSTIVDIFETCMVKPIEEIPLLSDNENGCKDCDYFNDEETKPVIAPVTAEEPMKQTRKEQLQVNEKSDPTTSSNIIPKTVIKITPKTTIKDPIFSITTRHRKSSPASHVPYSSPSQNITTPHSTTIPTSLLIKKRRGKNSRHRKQKSPGSLRKQSTQKQAQTSPQDTSMEVTNTESHHMDDDHEMLELDLDEKEVMVPDGKEVIEKDNDDELSCYYQDDIISLNSEDDLHSPHSYEKNNGYGLFDGCSFFYNRIQRQKGSSSTEPGATTSSSSSSMKTSHRKCFITDKMWEKILQCMHPPPAAAGKSRIGDEIVINSNSSSANQPVTVDETSVKGNHQAETFPVPADFVNDDDVLESLIDHLDAATSTEESIKVVENNLKSKDELTKEKEKEGNDHIKNIQDLFSSDEDEEDEEFAIIEDESDEEEEEEDALDFENDEFFYRKKHRKRKQIVPVTRQNTRSHATILSTTLPKRNQTIKTTNARSRNLSSSSNITKHANDSVGQFPSPQTIFSSSADSLLPELTPIQQSYVNEERRLIQDDILSSYILIDDSCETRFPKVLHHLIHQYGWSYEYNTKGRFPTLQISPTHSEIYFRSKEILSQKTTGLREYILNYDYFSVPEELLTFLKSLLLTAQKHAQQGINAFNKPFYSSYFTAIRESMHSTHRTKRKKGKVATRQQDEERKRKRKINSRYDDELYHLGIAEEDSTKKDNKRARSITPKENKNEKKTSPKASPATMPTTTGSMAMSSGDPASIPNHVLLSHLTSKSKLTVVESDDNDDDESDDDDIVSVYSVDVMKERGNASKEHSVSSAEYNSFDDEIEIIIGSPAPAPVIIPAKITEQSIRHDEMITKSDITADPPTTRDSHSEAAHSPLLTTESSVTACASSMLPTSTTNPTTMDIPSLSVLTSDTTAVALSDDIPSADTGIAIHEDYNGDGKDICSNETTCDSAYNEDMSKEAALSTTTSTTATQIDMSRLSVLIEASFEQAMLLVD